MQYFCLYKKMIREDAEIEINVKKNELKKKLAIA